MPERSIAIRVDEALYKRVKIRIAEIDITLKDYIVGLIQKDLDESDPIKWKAAPGNSSITSEQVAQAQSILDFVNDIIRQNSDKEE
ncbi:hypothetical protein [Candidatus Agathobaculum pullicola]|uniref:hypothetical protein n=1 Tax=Candidatus Agathobaculum pullicola TaxID=2838426 RepID=UPI003F8F0DA8